MNTTSISVLMPVRNDSATLQKCLDDISCQTFTNYELVLVDDGSSDDSLNLMQNESRKDSRVRVISTEPKGIVSALNTGLAACKGEYIARMDADDRMLPLRLEKQYAYMKLNPDLDLIGCCVEGFTAHGRLPQSAENYQAWNNSLISHEQIERDLFAESPIMHPTFFGSIQLFKKLGYNNHPWAEDYDFLMRAYGVGAKFGKHPDTLLRKFHAPERLSRTEAIYKRPALLDAKVHYLLEFNLLKEKRGVVIVGTGPTGRQVSNSFEKRRVPILGFVDNRKGPPDRSVKKCPAWGFPDLPPIEFIQQNRDALFILAIVDAVGQTAYSDLFLKAGFIENQNFVRVI